MVKVKNKKRITDVGRKTKDKLLTKSVIDIDKYIMNLLYAKRFIRKSELMTLLSAEYGISGMTIERKLESLQERHQIIKIRSDEFGRFGIADKDSRSVYIASKETKDMKDYIDAIFELFKSQDADEIKQGVRALRQHGTTYFRKYFLDGEQLNILTEVLDKSLKNEKLNDDEFRNNLLMILFNEMVSNKTRPIDKEPFLETLRTLLDLYPTVKFYNQPNNPIPYLIQILGIYRDTKLITRLEEDAFSGTVPIFSSLSGIYGNKFTAKLIEDNKIALLKIGIKLQKAGKREGLDFIENIQRQAAYALQELERNEFEKELYL